MPCICDLLHQVEQRCGHRVAGEFAWLRVEGHLEQFLIIGHRPILSHTILPVRIRNGGCSDSGAGFGLPHPRHRGLGANGSVGPQMMVKSGGSSSRPVIVRSSRNDCSGVAISELSAMAELMF